MDDTNIVKDEVPSTTVVNLQTFVNNENSDFQHHVAASAPQEPTAMPNMDEERRGVTQNILEQQIQPTVPLETVPVKAFQPIPPHVPRRAYTTEEKQLWLNRASEIGLKPASRELAGKWSVTTTGALSMIKKWRKKREAAAQMGVGTLYPPMLVQANDVYGLWEDAREFFASRGFGIASAIMSAAISTENKEPVYFDNNMQLALSSTHLSLLEHPIYVTYRDLRVAHINPQVVWNHVKEIIMHLTTGVPAVPPTAPSPPPASPSPPDSPETLEAPEVPEPAHVDKKPRMSGPMLTPPVLSPLVTKTSATPGSYPRPLFPSRQRNAPDAALEQLDMENPLHVLHIKKAREVYGFVADCNDYPAVFVPNIGKLLVLTENGTWKEMSGSEFERFAGRANTKKWKESVRLYLEGGGRVTVKRWLMTQEIAMGTGQHNLTRPVLHPQAQVTGLVPAATPPSVAQHTSGQEMDKTGGLLPQEAHNFLSQMRMQRVDPPARETEQLPSVHSTIQQYIMRQYQASEAAGTHPTEAAAAAVAAAYPTLPTVNTIFPLVSPVDPAFQALGNQTATFQHGNQVETAYPASNGVYPPAQTPESHFPPPKVEEVNYQTVSTPYPTEVATYMGNTTVGLMGGAESTYSDTKVEAYHVGQPVEMPYSGLAEESGNKDLVKVAGQENTASMMISGSPGTWPDL